MRRDWYKCKRLLRKLKKRVKKDLILISTRQASQLMKMIYGNSPNRTILNSFLTNG